LTPKNQYLAGHFISKISNFMLHYRNTATSSFEISIDMAMSVISCPWRCFIR